jgi:hypothetical protein
MREAREKLTAAHRRVREEVLAKVFGSIISACGDLNEEGVASCDGRAGAADASPSVVVGVGAGVVVTGISGAAIFLIFVIHKRVSGRHSCKLHVRDSRV